MTHLSELVAVITGASSGIGEATAKELAAHGTKVMLAARREDRLRMLQSEIEAGGGTARYCVTDVTSREQVQNLVDETIKTFGAVDVMFNNAGIMLLAPMDKRLVAEWDRMIDVNIKGVLYGMAAVLPHMTERGKGHIINNASVAGHRLFHSAAVYCATKFAVRAISEGFRMEIGDRIRTTIISPGAVATELPDHISDEATKENLMPAYAQAIGPDAIARAVRFAIEQPANVDVNEIIVRPTAQAL
ncbi:MAG: SDR family oxidoreductase [Phycisphaerales bacterium]|nr:MAG: SDR family oxidoreductase [Phycisphaerales bacterium]